MGELNKFYCLMDLLQEEVPEFRHLVVVDRSFEVFSRIWCMAEIAQAYTSDIPQRVQLISCSDFRNDSRNLCLYERLTSIQIKKAEATRPEDKDAILAKIPDLNDFDARLQAAIVGKHGLLGQHLAGFRVWEAAANTARRVKALSLTLHQPCTP